MLYTYMYKVVKTLYRLYTDINDWEFKGRIDFCIWKENQGWCSFESCIRKFAKYLVEKENLWLY